MRTTLLVLGGSRYYSRAIQYAVQSGFRVILMDRDPQAYCARYVDKFYNLDFSEPEEVSRVGKAERVTGVLPLNDYGVVSASRLASEMGLTGLSHESARICTSKSLMRAAWQKHAVPSARFVVSASSEHLFSQVCSWGIWPVVVKPDDSRGGGSRGVTVARDERELGPAIAYAQSVYTGGRVIVEEYLSGTEHSAETLSINGKTSVLAIGDKVKTPIPYRVDRSVIYPTQLAAEVVEKVTRTLGSAVRAVGIDNGPAHIEFCVGPTGPRLFEIGARCGGGGTSDPIVPFVSGIPYLAEVINLAVGRAPGSLVPTRQRGCVYHFLCPNPGIVKRVVGLSKVRKWEGILDCDVLVKAGDEVPMVRKGADRAGFLIAGGDNRTDALALAHKAERAITIETYDG